MTAITIAEFDERGVLTTTLHDILLALGLQQEETAWKICSMSAIIGADPRGLNGVQGQDDRITHGDFVQHSELALQVQEGKFRGFRPGAVAPWIVIYAVDATEWEIVTDDAQAVTRLRASFRNAKELHRYSAKDL